MLEGPEDSPALTKPLLSWLRSDQIWHQPKALLKDSHGVTKVMLACSILILHMSAVMHQVVAVFTVCT